MKSLPLGYILKKPVRVKIPAVHISLSIQRWVVDIFSQEIAVNSTRTRFYRFIFISARPNLNTCRKAGFLLNHNFHKSPLGDFLLNLHNFNDDRKSQFCIARDCNRSCLF
jgi:hypothetical protein